MPLLTKDLFFDRLLVHPQSTIVACNIVDSVDEKVFDDRFARELLDWWWSLYRWRVRTSTHPGKMERAREQTELLDTLDALLFANQSDGFRPGERKPAFLLVGKQDSQENHKRHEFANARWARLLFDQLVTERDRKRLIGEGILTVANDLPGRPRYLVRNNQKIQVELRPTVTVGASNCALWLTPIDSLQRELREENRMGNDIRDRLGLIHYDTMKPDLVALHLPGNKLTESVYRPTTGDAGSHRRFRTRADLSSHRRPRTRGFTVDLRKFAEGKERIDGLPEQVTKPVPGSRLGKIDVTPLHAITITRGLTVDDNDAAFAIRICARHDGSTAIRTRLDQLK